MTEKKRNIKFITADNYYGMSALVCNTGEMFIDPVTTNYNTM